MSSTACPPHARHVAPQTLAELQNALPDHPIIIAALEDARTGRINYGTLANLAALADQTHVPALTKAVLELFATLSSSPSIAPTAPRHRALQTA